MRRPSLNALTMFDAAARHLNFRLAAEEQNLTQGAVAQQIRHLEASLDIKLFTRLPRGLALTEAGAKYHKEIGKALALIDQATSQLCQARSRLTLTMPPSLASKWMMPRLPDFRKAFPDIDLQLDASETLKDFRKDRINLAIRMIDPLRLQKTEEITIRSLSRLDLHAIAPEPMPDIKGPEDFQYLPLVQDGHHFWEKLFQAAGLEIKERLLQLNQTALAIDAVINGQGLALVPEILLQQELSTRKVYSVWQDQTDHSYGFYLLYPVQDKSTSSLVTEVADWLIGQTGKSPERA